jgi:hypothetical protein
VVSGLPVMREGDLGYRIRSMEPHTSNTSNAIPKDPFYVDSACCTACGVPQHVAPDLVGWTNDKMSQCFWKKQPATEAEFRQAFAIFDNQELGCHRYSGRDPDIQARVGIDNCDYPISGPRSYEWGTPPVFGTLEMYKRRGRVATIFAKLFRR